MRKGGGSERMEVGKDNVVFTHLQLADDTLFLLDEEETNLLWSSEILKSFCSMSGLKINMDKSVLVGINVEENKVRNWQI